MLRLPGRLRALQFGALFAALLLAASGCGQQAKLPLLVADLLRKAGAI